MVGVYMGRRGVTGLYMGGESAQGTYMVDVYLTFYKTVPWELPRWKSGIETTYQSQGQGSIPGPGKPHTPGHLSLSTTVTVACAIQGLRARTHGPLCHSS